MQVQECSIVLQSSQPEEHFSVAVVRRRVGGETREGFTSVANAWQMLGIECNPIIA